METIAPFDEHTLTLELLLHLSYLYYVPHPSLEFHGHRIKHDVTHFSLITSSFIDQNSRYL